MNELHFVGADAIGVVGVSDLAEEPGGPLDGPLVVSAADDCWLFDFGDVLPDPDELDSYEVALITESVVAPPEEPAVVLRGGRVIGVWLEQRTPGAGPNASPPVARGSLIDVEPGPGSPPTSGTVGQTTEAERVAGEISDLEPTVRASDRTAPDHAIALTPHLGAPTAVPTAAGSTFEVSVRLDNDPFGPDESGEQFALEVPPDLESVTIGVLLTMSSHFQVRGDTYQRLLIKLDRDEAGPITFDVEVTATGEGDEAGITALLVYNGHSCGSVTRRWSWDTAAETARPKRPAAESSEANVALETEPPGLSVFVTRPVNDGVHFCCAVQSPLLDAYLEPTEAIEWALPEDTPRFVRSWLDRIVSGDDRRSALLEAGVEFYDAAPPAFKTALWDIIDGGKAPCSIYIASSEPSLPWELMVPHRSDDDGIEVDRRPLGVEFPIGRWIRGDHKSPSPSRIEVSRSFVVAPRSKKPRQLDATSEVEFLSTELGGERIDPATKRDLERRFASESAELIHFVCHGAAGEDGDLLYLDDDKSLRATAVRTSRGFKRLCRASRPLVFINACEAGALTPTVGGVGGFPKALGEIGARAVIAPLWSVVSSTAGALAVEIYERALATPSPTLGEVIRDVRARSYDDDEFDDSFAAYCLFGDPQATLTRPSG